jgi:hypothetical protein
MNKTRVWSILAAIALALASIGLGLWANSAIRLGLLVAHTPVSWTVAVLPGPAAVQGRAKLEREKLTGPFSNTQCVFFRKLIEREKRDSDGNTSWETVEDTSRFVPFRVTDKSGSLLINPVGAEFRAPQVHRHQAGKLRYTEYAIRPGDEVFVFGDSDGQQLRSADRVPFLVSGFGEEQYRVGKGILSLLLCSFAILSAAFAVYFWCVAFRWHHVFVYLAMLTTILPLWLFTQWFLLATSQFEFADTVLAAAQQHIQRTEPDTVAAALLKDVHNDGIHRVDAYRAKFPNQLAARSAGLRPFERIELSATEQKHAASYPLRPRPGANLAVWAGVIFGCIGFASLVTFTWLGFRRLKVKRLIENLPTTPAAGVVVGAAEVSGAPAEGPSWIKSRYLGARCVWYKSQTKEKRQSGKNTRWVVIDSAEEGTPFQLADSSGEIRVDPSKAKITGRRALHRREGKRIKTEWLIDQSDSLYVLGPARLANADDDFLSITHDNETPYLITIRSEDEVQTSFARRGFAFTNFALIGGTITLLTVMAMRGFSPFDFFLSGLFPPLYLAILSIFFMYNDLVFMRNRMHRALSMIDVALKKRADLVPQLVDVTQAYLQHEGDTQQALAAMRAAPSDSVVDIQQALTTQAAGVQRWLGVVESYPDLKASEVVMQLQHRLTCLENEIAFCRQSYNDTLERYNTRIGTLPDLLIALPCGFRASTFLQYESEVQNVPSVSG